MFSFTLKMHRKHLAVGIQGDPLRELTFHRGAISPKIAMHSTSKGIFDIIVYDSLKLCLKIYTPK